MQFMNFREAFLEEFEKLATIEQMRWLRAHPSLPGTQDPFYHMPWGVAGHTYSGAPQFFYRSRLLAHGSDIEARRRGLVPSGWRTPTRLRPQYGQRAENYLKSRRFGGGKPIEDPGAEAWLHNRYLMQKPRSVSEGTAPEVVPVGPTREQIRARAKARLAAGRAARAARNVPVQSPSPLEPIPAY